MARTIGGLGSSHVPSISGAIARGEQQTPYWSLFFDGFSPVHDWLFRERPDLAIVIYNDHGLNFFQDKMPTFAVGAAHRYDNADEGWGIPVLPSFEGDSAFSWHLIVSLVSDEFDVTTCQEMLVDHAFTLPLKLMNPHAGAHWPARTIPVAVNSVQHPLPTAARCWKLSQAIGRAVEGYPEDMKILVIASGGLSHQLDGTRAGFVNKEFDLFCLDKIIAEPEALTHYTNRQIIEKAGSLGVELLTWITMRGALQGQVSKVTSSYHVPVSNTGGAIMLLRHDKAPAPLMAE